MPSSTNTTPTGTTRQVVTKASIVTVTGATSEVVKTVAPATATATTLSTTTSPTPTTSSSSSTTKPAPTSKPTSSSSAPPAWVAAPITVGVLLLLLLLLLLLCRRRRRKTTNTYTDKSKTSYTNNYPTGQYRYDTRSAAQAHQPDGGMLGRAGYVVRGSHGNQNGGYMHEQDQYEKTEYGVIAEEAAPRAGTPGPRYGVRTGGPGFI